MKPGQPTPRKPPAHLSQPARPPKLETLRGRSSIFRNKKGGGRVNGTLTPRGSVRFELHRKMLAGLVAREPEEISDADVVEYLTRGEEETRDYINGKRKD